MLNKNLLSGKCCHNGREITAEEYAHILSIIRARPKAPEGYGYRLTEELTWERYELSAEEETDEEVSAEEALAELREVLA